MSNCTRRGFTLVEVMVALAIGSLLLLMARQIIVQIAADAGEIVSAAADHDRSANRELLLRDLLGSVQLDIDAGDRFFGDQLAARFTSWCDVADGWQERCDITIGFIGDEDQQALVALFPTGHAEFLMRDFVDGALRYIKVDEGGSRWWPVWGDAVMAPAAVGVITDGDTLIVRIGERG